MGTAIVKHILAPLVVFIFERILGWRMQMDTSSAPRFILLAAPHTTNWDTMVMFHWACKHRRKVHYVIKKESENWFLVGRFLRWTGAIFIDRDAPLSALKAILKASRANDRFILLFAPSGTRSYSEGWKPGFYYIAQKTKMPFLPVGADYVEKVGKVGELFYPTGDIDADIEAMRPFYEQIHAKYPERVSPIRLIPEVEKDKDHIPVI